MPEVSVVLPTYNRADLLPQAIDSVLAQTYEEVELLVIDDGSTDATREVVTAYADPRIAYYHQPNQGRSAARNRGIALARGTYVAFLDSDDRYLPDSLARQVATLKAHPELGMVYGPHLRIDATGRPLKYVAASPPEVLRDSVIFTWAIGVPATLIRRTVLDAVGGFDEEPPIAEDLDLWHRIVSAYPVGRLDEPVCEVRLHGGMTNRAPDIYLRWTARLAERVLARQASAGWRYRRRTWAIPYERAAMLALRAESSEHTPGWYARQSLKYWPFGWRAWVLWLLAAARALAPALTRRMLLHWRDRSGTALR